jgi:hypothetical protein
MSPKREISAIEEGRKSLAIATLSFLLLPELAVLSRSQGGGEVPGLGYLHLGLFFF